MKLITFAAASQITICDPSALYTYKCRLQELERGGYEIPVLGMDIIIV
jgi:hypothetical protein